MTNWTTLHMEVTTPLFNGDADPEREAGGQPGVRVPSLRGAMRFWFRALVGGVTGPDLPLLAALERTVFGSTDASCPVPLRIPNPPVQRAGRAEQLDRWIVYLLGPGPRRPEESKSKPALRGARGEVRTEAAASKHGPKPPY